MNLYTLTGMVVWLLMIVVFGIATIFALLDWPCHGDGWKTFVLRVGPPLLIFLGSLYVTMRVIPFWHYL